MPNTRKHIAYGAGLGALAGLSWQLVLRVEEPRRQIDWAQIAMCSLAGAAFGVLPDILEPATSPNHRQICHSMAAAMCVGKLLMGKNIPLPGKNPSGSWHFLQQLDM